MGSLVIGDLTEDAELDSEALRAVAGGRSGLGLLAGNARLRAAEPAQSQLVRGLVKGGLIEPPADEGVDD
jgi:hypothetical protein